MTGLALAAIADVPPSTALPPLAAVTEGAITALVTSPILVPDGDGPSPEETERAKDTLLALDRALLAAAAETTVVPVRFGSVFQSGAHLSDALREDAPGWDRTLKSVRGCREYRLSVDLSLRAHAQVKDLSGRDYLALRRAERDARRASDGADTELISAIDAALAPLARAVRQLSAPKPGAVAVAILAKPRSMDRITGALEAVLASAGAPKSQLSGPWPLYSFSEAFGATV